MLDHVLPAPEWRKERRGGLWHLSQSTGTWHRDNRICDSTAWTPYTTWGTGCPDREDSCPFCATEWANQLMLRSVGDV